MFAQMIGSCHSLFKVKCVVQGYDHWDFPEDTKWITRGGSCLPQGRKRLRVYDLMIDQNDGLNGRQFGRSCLGNDSKIISGQDFQTSRKLWGRRFAKFKGWCRQQRCFQTCFKIFDRIVICEKVYIYPS